ncbi:MAG: hypothetical protein KME20_04850 [Kaiparowitsia implicata GSE-PSE-MK54-09C]|nr:hypothetical protein [Kaiparowitsia implicata GSE-PSE-MK54-09C]
MLEQKPTPPPTALIVRVEEAETDEIWSIVQSKEPQRWLWHALDSQTGSLLAYVLEPLGDRWVQYGFGD